MSAHFLHFPIKFQASPLGWCLHQIESPPCCNDWPFLFGHHWDCCLSFTEHQVFIFSSKLNHPSLAVKLLVIRSVPPVRANYANQYERVRELDGISPGKICCRLQPFFSKSTGFWWISLQCLLSVAVQGPEIAVTSVLYFSCFRGEALVISSHARGLPYLNYFCILRSNFLICCTKSSRCIIIDLWYLKCDFFWKVNFRQTP